VAGTAEYFLRNKPACATYVAANTIKAGGDIEILPESICFLDQYEGWLAGRRPVFSGQAIPSGGMLLHTTDGGKHWNSVQLVRKIHSSTL
jgi:photosystem II stability/assembly factor-like uncharacterized protein